LNTRTQPAENFFSNPSSIYNTSLDTEYLTEFRSQFSDLSTEAKSLITEETDSVFNERIVSSSNTDVLTASADSGASTTEYDIQVNQLARAQLNESASFTGDAENSFTTGVNTIQISQGDQTEELSVSVLSGDTNSDVLNNLEQKINDSELDVNADIITNDDGTIQLQFESSETGTSDKFSVSNVSGDLAAQTNLDNTVRTARDAEYDVDGTSEVSTSNQVEIDEGQVSLDLQATGSATVTASTDNEAVIEATQSFVDQFNETVSFLQDNFSHSDSFETGQELVQIIDRNENDLSSIGIDTGINGSLSIDEEKLSQSLEEDYEGVKETLGSVTGVVSEVNEEVENDLSDPTSQYSQLSDFSLYDQSGQSTFPFSSMYSGSLFDSYF
ncbi:MAG: flagellar filament capping protein FliD, partial [Bacillota bacterium]